MQSYLSYGCVPCISDHTFVCFSNDVTCRSLTRHESFQPGFPSSVGSVVSETPFSTPAWTGPTLDVPGNMVPKNRLFNSESLLGFNWHTLEGASIDRFFLL